MIQARSYQTEAVSSIYSYFSTKKGNPVVAMPTGTGKSVVIAMFLESVFRQYPSQRIMILTHVKELIQQNYEKLITLWPFAPAGIYSSGLSRKDVNAPITFAGIASVAKKWALFGHIDLVIIDEAHLVNPKEVTMYKTFLEGLISINPKLKIIGLTATPWRIGQGRIIDPIRGDDGKDAPSIFTDFCFDITGVEAFNRLIAEGYLAPLIPKSTATKLDIDGVHMRGGEFIASELQYAVDKNEITTAAVQEALELGHDRHHWLVFAAGVEHAIHTAEVMNDLGIPTVAIHSKLSDKERDKAIAQFKAGHYRAAVNNNVLTTGFDFPAIDLILCLRPTASAVLWVQMLGRGTRPWPGKLNCLVLDFARNTKRLGPINDPVVPRKKGDRGGDAPIKECPLCGTYVHASLRFCNGVTKHGTACTYEFKFETKLVRGAATDDIVKGDIPIVEVFKVDHITFSMHRKQDRPPTMRVSYYCGFKAFEQYVAFEHTNYAGRRAQEWWAERSVERCPTTTAEALELVERTRPPTHIRVWTNKQFPEVLASCFDGTAFGAQEAEDLAPMPSLQASKKARGLPIPPSAPATIKQQDEFEDDIPF